MYKVEVLPAISGMFGEGYDSFMYQEYSTLEQATAKFEEWKREYYDLVRIYGGVVRVSLTPPAEKSEEKSIEVRFEREGKHVKVENFPRE